MCIRDRCNSGCIPLRGCARDGSFTVSRPRASTGTSRAKTNPRGRSFPVASARPRLPPRARDARVPSRTVSSSSPSSPRASPARRSRVTHHARVALCRVIPRRHRDARDDDARLARGRPRLVASLGWKSSATATESRATRDARVDERGRARDGREGDGDGDPRGEDGQNADVCRCPRARGDV